MLNRKRIYSGSRKTANGVVEIDMIFTPTDGKFKISARSRDVILHNSSNPRVKTNFQRDFAKMEIVEDK